MPVSKINKGTLTLENVRETMLSRFPIPVDTFTCSCGGTQAVVALAAMSHPCPDCRGHLLYRCTTCNGWLCLSCIVKAAMECRVAQGLNTIAQLTILPS